MVTRAHTSRPIAGALLGVLALMVYGLLGGCGAQRLPPRLTSAEAELAARAPMPYSVVVANWNLVPGTPLSPKQQGENPDAYADGAFKWLKQSGAFREVRRATTVRDSADFVAVSTGLYCNTAIIPVWTGLSLGIVPTVFNDTSCEEIVLHRFGAPPGSDSVVIRSVIEGRVIMGWIAVGVGAFPGWTHGQAQDHRRGHDYVRLAAIKEQGALAALLTR